MKSEEEAGQLLKILCQEDLVEYDNKKFTDSDWSKFTCGDIAAKFIFMTKDNLHILAHGLENEDLSLYTISAFFNALPNDLFDEKNPTLFTTLIGSFTNFVDWIKYWWTSGRHFHIETN